MKTFLTAMAATALLTGAAAAADLPRRAPPPIFTPIPVFTWTGFYAGLHSAYAFTDNENIRTTGLAAATQRNVDLGYRPASLKSEVDGFARIGGGAGYNYQFTPGSGFVAGVAFDISWTDLQKNIGYIGNPNPVAAPATPNASVFTQNLDYLGTFNGKLGYAFDRFLVYATGGLAFGNVSYGASFYGTATQGFPLQFIGGYDVNFETGYNYGGGVEYAIPADSFLSYFSVAKYLGIGGAATIKAEYIHYDLGSRSINVLSVTGNGTGYNSRFSTEGSIIRAGFNYKFSGL